MNLSTILRITQILFVLVLFRQKLQPTNNLENIEQSFPAVSDPNPVDLLLLYGSEKFNDKKKSCHINAYYKLLSEICKTTLIDLPLFWYPFNLLPILPFLPL